MSDRSLPPTALPAQDVDGLFGVLLAELRNMSIPAARAALGEAGITGLNTQEQRWASVLPAADDAYHRLTPDRRLRAIGILANTLSKSERVRNLFAQHGYEFINGHFVPVGLFDQREAQYLPPSSASELARAMSRLADGDESGAITAACGSVDILMQQLYAAHGLGDPGKTGYAAKVGTVFKHLIVFGDMKNELIDAGIKSDDAEEIVTAMRKLINHAAETLQTFRRVMSDAHGSKPTLRRSAYDAIKWASAICGLLEGRS